ncbi:hypothetical protein ISF6_1411 [Piscinibacter sakaiensis]|uniref:Uncharacterized protein n=2 Tax=Piscinibacter sakaiensis TaxID=1547922 RepID=A0A0K8NZ24_PISS1|nr:hypothetical protein ISF6_1411 [Piscinibacter sakaiensis]
MPSPTCDPAELVRLHGERGDILYRTLGRLMAGLGSAEVDAACHETWRRTRAQPRADPWLTLLRQACLVAEEHLARHTVLDAAPALLSHQAAAAHAAWLAVPAPPPGAVVSDGEEIRHWRRLGDVMLIALAELPLQHRAALLLHHDLMLPLSDIALVLQQPTQTVHEMVWTALLHLRCRVGDTLLVPHG